MPKIALRYDSMIFRGSLIYLLGLLILIAGEALALTFKSDGSVVQKGGQTVQSPEINEQSPPFGTTPSKTGYLSRLYVHQFNSEVPSEAKGTGSLHVDIDNDGEMELFGTDIGTKGKPDKIGVYEWKKPKKLTSAQISQGLKKHSGWQRVFVLANDQCVHARKSVASDFDNDGFTDVAVACTGTDSPPYKGGHIVIFWNEKGKGFTSTRVSKKSRVHHSLDAADFNKDGLMDIIAVTGSARQVPLFLNKGNRIFKVKNHFSSVPKKVYWTVALPDVDDDGDFDIFLAGDDSGTIGSNNHADATIYFNENGRFKRKTVIPNDAVNGLVLDVLVWNTDIFVLRTKTGRQNKKGSKVDWNKQGASKGWLESRKHSGAYSTTAVQRTDLFGKKNEQFFFQDCPPKYTRKSACWTTFWQAWLQLQQIGDLVYLTELNRPITPRRKLLLGK